MCWVVNARPPVMALMMPSRRSPNPPWRSLAIRPSELKKSNSMGVDGTFLNGATIRLANRLNHQSIPKNDRMLFWNDQVRSETINPADTPPVGSARPIGSPRHTS